MPSERSFRPSEAVSTRALGFARPASVSGGTVPESSPEAASDGGTPCPLRLVSVVRPSASFTVIATAVMHPYFLPCRSFDKQFVFMA